MFHRVRAVLFETSPLLLIALLVIVLSVGPAAILGLELFRTIHRLSADETAISQLHAAEIAGNTSRIRSKAPQAEVVDVIRRVTVLETEVHGILMRLAAGTTGPAATALQQQEQADQAQIAVLTERLVALTGGTRETHGPSRVRGPSEVPGPAAEGHVDARCVLAPVLLCAGAG
jgi:hypothetical protein